MYTCGDSKGSLSWSLVNLQGQLHTRGKGKSKNRMSKKSHLTREIQESSQPEKQSAHPLRRIKKAHVLPINQSHAAHGLNPPGNLSPLITALEDTGQQQSPFSHSLLSSPDQPTVTWIIKSPQHHLNLHDESHDRKPALLSSPHFPIEDKSVFSSKATKWCCLLRKEGEL